MSISRRTLLAKISLAIPAAAALAISARAEAATTTGTHHHRHKSHAKTASRKHGTRSTAENTRAPQAT